MTKTFRLSAILLAATATASAADWPQWRGPDRTGVSKETGLLKSWPAGGPKRLWTASGLGIGFSSIAVVGGRIFTMGDRGDECFVVALNASDGSEVWAVKVGDKYLNGNGDGPRCTPTVDGDVLYAETPNGDVVCLQTADGKQRWHRSLTKDFGGGRPGWGYSESPLVDGDRVIVTPGGAKAGLAALNKSTGETVWMAPVPTAVSAKVNKEKLGPQDDLKLTVKDGVVTATLNGSPIELGEVSVGKSGNFDSAQYSSPIVVTIGGVKQYVQFFGQGVAAVSAEGKFLWRYDHAANGTANCSTPVFFEDSVFAASGYGTGGGLAKEIAEGGAFRTVEAYFTKSMKNHHGGMVAVDGHLYGFSDGNGLVCLDLKTGKPAWQQRNAGKGSLVFADGRLYTRREDGKGTVTMVEATPAEYRELGRFDQPDRSTGPRVNNAWAHPVVAEGRLYLRDHDKLLCYDVKGP